MTKSDKSVPVNAGQDLPKGVDPHDPDVLDAKPKDQKYSTVDDALDNQTATGQLASMLDNASTNPDNYDEEEPDNEGDKGHAIDWIVTGITGAIVLAIVIWGLAGSGSFANFANDAFSFVVNDLGWAYILFTTIFVVFVLWLALSKFGSIRLGRVNEEPEFNTFSWIAMMFAAGMGIGLMFFGASEPLSFFKDGVPGHEAGEVDTSMATAMFHWTLHPWAIYAIVGLAIAYSTFRIGRKQLLSSAFVPLIGQKLADGWLGKLIDILSVFATVFGTACSLGLGALQIQAGLSASGFIEDPSDAVVIGIVLVLTLAFVLSTISGVGKGIQYLSNSNMILAALLAIFVFILGPTVDILNLIPGSVGAYLDNFTEMIGRTAESTPDSGEWLSGWTIFYWAWWVSWSPFVGMFLARISRGRSVREFCVGVLLVPAGVSTIWFAIFGGTAIKMEQNGDSITGETQEEELFNLLQSMPLGAIASLVAMVLLATFFITSADSASTVMGSMSQNGTTDAKRWLSAAWGVLTAAVGLTLLLTAGEDALNNLQSVTIVAAAPFLLIVFLLMFAIVKDLRNDIIYLEYREAQNFQRKLARERRIHRERQRREALKRRRSSRLKAGKN